MNCRNWPAEFNFTVDNPNDPNMNRIMKDLEKLENMVVMRKIFDDLNDAHRNLSSEKNEIYEEKMRYNWLANETIKLFDYIAFIVENFEVKLFNTLKSVELKKMIVTDEVKDFLKAKDNKNEDKEKLKKIADDLSEEIRNVYEFLRHEFIFINDWKNWVEEVEAEMTRPDDAFKAMIDRGSCDLNVFDYTLNKMINSCGSYLNHPTGKLFLTKFI